jgi:plasmid stabilization system protein ParE
MTYRVRISPTALQEAEAIYAWIATNSPENAATWFNALFDVIQSLETMPFRCSLAPESDILGEEIRQYIYRKNYRILFNVEGEVVRIYHIRHVAQQFLTKEDF